MKDKINDLKKWMVNNRNIIYKIMVILTIVFTFTAIANIIGFVLNPSFGLFVVMLYSVGFVTYIWMLILRRKYSKLQTNKYIEIRKKVLIVTAIGAIFMLVFGGGIFPIIIISYFIYREFLSDSRRMNNGGSSKYKFDKSSNQRRIQSNDVDDKFKF